MNTQADKKALEQIEKHLGKAWSKTFALSKRSNASFLLEMLGKDRRSTVRAGKA
jgi:hypothetical protein